jgi:hypothetical protein
MIPFELLRIGKYAQRGKCLGRQHARLHDPLGCFGTGKDYAVSATCFPH